MANFELAVEYVLRNEDLTLSGKVEVDNNGGKVRYGINEKSNSAPAGFFEAMPNSEALPIAKDIYHQNYWQLIHGDALTSDAVAAKLLDMAVNMGVRESVLLLQRSLNNLHLPTGVDGVIGPQTIGAANQANEEELLKELATEACGFYSEVVARKPEDRKFIHNWQARAEKVPSVA